MVTAPKDSSRTSRDWKTFVGGMKNTGGFVYSTAKDTFNGVRGVASVGGNAVSSAGNVVGRFVGWLGSHSLKPLAILGKIGSFSIGKIPVGPIAILTLAGIGIKKGFDYFRHRQERKASLGGRTEQQVTQDLRAETAQYQAATPQQARQEKTVYVHPEDAYHPYDADHVSSLRQRLERQRGYSPQHGNYDMSTGYTNNPG
jgi:hypothetical protein